MTGLPQPTMLVIIDVQNDFCPGGALAVPDGDAILPAITRLQQAFGHCVLTQDWHPAGHRSFASSHPDGQAYATVTLPYGEQTLWPDHCVAGSAGAQFHRALDTGSADLIIRKGFRAGIDSYSAFQENDRTTSTGLEGYLRARGIDHVVLCGLALDFCVAWSALDARRLGFATTVVIDACRAIDLDGSAAAMTGQMQASGVRLVETDALLDAWQAS